MGQITPDETLLGLLAARARHGYQLIDCFRDTAQLGRVWDLSTSQLYAVLKRLEAQGFIVGHEVSTGEAPNRTEYSLTDAGFARLERWLSDEQPSASVRRVRVEFLSRLYIARLLNTPTHQIVTRQKLVCQQRRMALIAARDCAEPGVGLLSLELAVAQLDAILNWIDRCELKPFQEDDHPPIPRPLFPPASTR